MKTFVIGALLSANVFAGGYMKMSTCTGTSPQGDPLKFTLYVEDDFYCVERDKFKGIVADEMGAYDLDIAVNAKGDVLASVVFQDEQRGELKLMEFNFEDFGCPTIQKAKVRLLDEDHEGNMSYKESEFTCANIEYHMDC